MQEIAAAQGGNAKGSESLHHLSLGSRASCYQEEEQASPHPLPLHPRELLDHTEVDKASPPPAPRKIRQMRRVQEPQLLSVG